MNETDINKIEMAGSSFYGLFTIFHRYVGVHVPIFIKIDNFFLTLFSFQTNEIMEITPQLIISLALSVLGSIALIYSLHKVPRTGGKELIHHLIYFVCIGAVVILVPVEIRIIIFSPLGIRVIGNVFPLYESIRAIATPETSDDKLWLQFWISQGLVFYVTEWVEDFTVDNLSLYLYFYHIEMFFFLWLYLPYTDGATLVFDTVTQPYIAPIVEPLAKTFEGWLSMVVSAAVSATHIWILYAVFVFFPAGLKRFITVSVGTVYPLAASIVAVTTPQGDDDTFWLTYWSCYGILYLLMDWAENYIGKFPGFYLVVLFCTAYLMVPIFNGAEKVYRNILVPLTGQEEMLIYRDAVMVRNTFMKKVPKSRSKKMKKKLADLFAHNSDDESDIEGGVVGIEGEEEPLKGGYQSIE